jgi:2'-5' RNA ligase
MVALMPTAADAKRLAVDGGEDPDKLHLTLAYLGDNATDMPAESQQALHQVVGHLAAGTPPVAARAAGHLLFNPDGGPDGDRTPCAAYLVSDSPALTPLHGATSAAAGALAPDLTQHDPFIPHITGAYDRDAGALGYAGPVGFDRMRVSIGDAHTDYPLEGSAQEEAGETPEQEAAEDAAGQTKSGEEKSIPVEQVTISAADLDEMSALRNEIKAAAGDAGGPDNAMPDGSYQINHPGQLKTAINALTAYQVAKSKRGALRKHVIKHAKRLNAENMVPKSIKDEKDGDDEKKAGENKDVGAVADTKDAPATPTPDASADAGKYGTPSGTGLGAPHDAAAAQAQQNTGAVTAYKSLLAGDTSTVEPLNTMDTASLQDLTRVAYSYASTDPKVTALRTRLAAELARRGMKATDHGARGAAPVDGKTAAPPAGKEPGDKTPTTGPAQGKALDVLELEYKSAYTAEQAREMAKKGHALPDGSYPIANRADLKSAVGLRNHSKSYSQATVHKHIAKRAKAIGATDMLPEDMKAGAENKALSWDGAPDAFTAGVLLGLSGLDTEHVLELKAGPPGATFPSPDPNAKRLRDYWVHGKGAAKIMWGKSGDFDRCVTEMTKYVGERAKGLCNIYHRSALGVAPGQEGKTGSVAKAVGKMAGHGAKSLDPDGLETSAGQLWVRDTASVDGWRAYAPAWPLNPDLVAEMKALRPPAPDDEKDPAQPADGSDDDVLSALDNYAGMASQVSPEDAYLEGVGADIPWQLAATGDLVDPNSPGGEDAEVSQEGNLFGENGMADEVPDADNAGGDDEVDGQGEIGGPDSGADQAGENEPDDENAEPDEAAAIPEVAELLAALMAEQDAPLAPNDDNDTGEAEEDTTATNRRVPSATGS